MARRKKTQAIIGQRNRLNGSGIRGRRVGNQGGFSGFSEARNSVYPLMQRIAHQHQQNVPRIPQPQTQPNFSQPPGQVPAPQPVQQHQHGRNRHAHGGGGPGHSHGRGGAGGMGGGAMGGGTPAPTATPAPTPSPMPTSNPTVTSTPTSGTDWTSGYSPFTGSAADWWAQNVPLYNQGGATANAQHSAIQGGISTPNSRAYWNQPAQNDWTTAEWLYKPGTMPTNWSQFEADYGALPPETGVQDEWTALPYGYHTNPVTLSHSYNPGIGGFTPADVTAWKNAAPNTTNYLDPGEQFQGITLQQPQGAPLGFRGPKGNIYGAPTREGSGAYANPVAPDYYAPYQELQMLRDIVAPPLSGGDNGFSDPQQREIAANWFGSGGRGSLGELDYDRYLMGSYGPAGNPWEQFATQHGGTTATQRYAQSQPATY